MLSNIQNSIDSDTLVCLADLNNKNASEEINIGGIVCICELEDKILSETVLNLALNRKMDELLFTSKNCDPL